MWIDAWATAGESPLHLQLLGLGEYDERQFEGTSTHVAYKANTSNGRCVPLPIPAGAKPHEVAELHADIIQKYMRYPETGRKAE